MCVTVATLAQEGPSGWMLLPLSSLASAMSVSKRRSSSAPARGSWVDRVRRRDTHTVGISGMESPTGLRAVTNLWYEIQKKAVPCRPSIRTSSILSGLVEASTLVYIMLFWNPVREVRGITRGNLWHTTLVRATIPATRQATVAFDTLIDRLQTTLQALMQPDIPFTLELAQPPYRQTWVLGVQGEAEVICNILRNSTTLLLHRIPGSVIGEQRPLHISWQ